MGGARFVLAFDIDEEADEIDSNIFNIRNRFFDKYKI